MPDITRIVIKGSLGLWLKRFIGVFAVFCNVLIIEELDAENAFQKYKTFFDF